MAILNIVYRIIGLEPTINVNYTNVSTHEYMPNAAPDILVAVLIITLIDMLLLSKLVSLL